MSRTVAGSMQSMSMIFHPEAGRTVLSWEPDLDIIQIDTGSVTTWVRRDDLVAFLRAVDVTRKP